MKQQKAKVHMKFQDWKRGAPTTRGAPPPIIPVINGAPGKYSSMPGVATKRNNPRETTTTKTSSG